ncbi:UNVERIFIED_CONTAM: E3 ubiquitin-protein ligase SIS3 [Sesamum indicum]
MGEGATDLGARGGPEERGKGATEGWGKGDGGEESPHSLQIGIKHQRGTVDDAWVPRRATPDEGTSLLYAGRVQIIKSVLTSLSIYWASAFMLPKQIIKEIEKRLRRFLWKEMGSSGYAKVAWTEVCKLVVEGGQGLKDIGVLNQRLSGYNGFTKDVYATLLSGLLQRLEWHWPQITDRECLEIVLTLPMIMEVAIGSFGDARVDALRLKSYITYSSLLDNMETYSHLFFRCQYSRRCLIAIRRAVRFLWPNREWLTNIKWATRKWRGKYIINMAYRTLLGVCYIWRERNLRRFENIERSPTIVASVIIEDVRLRILSVNLSSSVDYTTVFIFRLLMFVDNGLAAGMGLDLGWQQRYARFCGRIVVLSILVALLYPFLLAWTIIGTLWFTRAKNCLPEDGQKWGFLIWLLFSYCGLVCIACICIGKWLTRRQAHLLRAQQGIPVSEYGVLVDMVRVPDWAIEAAGQEMRGMGQDAAAFQPGLYLTPAQREAVEALIQELPKFRLKAVPTDCSECPICLEEFHVGNELFSLETMQVRGLPCAHNFHVECIDEWLRLNVKCPRCRCSVFPNLDLSALSNIPTDSERSSSTNVVTTTQYVRNQPPSQSYRLRLQGLLRQVRAENAGSGSEADSAEIAATRGPPDATNRGPETTEPVQVLVQEPPPPWP